MELDILTLLQDSFVVQKVEKPRLAGSGELVFQPDFPGFAGHFPGQPVLPAVLQMATVRVLAMAIAERRLTPIETGKLKFSGMILPLETVHLQVQMERDEHRWSTGFKFFRDGKPLARGTLIFVEE
ncbi:MAG: beta-hydroxyacyl-ACP dehydratase [Proteobacteria bacterium]|nr:beta-hydroxyacyl-ACP dehydratase [Pseudomonadota bacterium]MBU1685864.1 beta-hydroxyacyl-ACP dehydratase [Pseudomonadota bacterium]